MIKTHLSWGDIELNLLTLTFPPKVENIYKEELFKKSLRHVRIALLLSIVFFGGFGILDAWTFRKHNTASGLSAMPFIAHLRWQYFYIPIPKALKIICRFVSLLLWRWRDSALSP